MRNGKNNAHSLFNADQSLANRSYQEYKRAGTAKLQAPKDNLTSIADQPFPSKLSFQPLIPAYTHSAIETGLHAAEHFAKGWGKYYLGPKVIATEVTLEAYAATQRAVNQGYSTSEARTCGVVSAGVQTGTAFVGHSALLTTAIGARVAGVMVRQPVLGKAAAGAILAGGPPLVEEGSERAGHLAEQLCHATFRCARELPKDLKNCQEQYKIKLKHLAR